MLENIKHIRFTDRLTAFLELFTYRFNFPLRSVLCIFLRVTYILGKITVSAGRDFVTSVKHWSYACQYSKNSTVSNCQCWHGILSSNVCLKT